MLQRLQILVAVPGEGAAYGCNAFTEAGHVCHVCGSFGEALQALRDVSFDLILGHAALAAENDAEIIQVARRRAPDAGILVLMAPGAPGLSEALDAGADGHTTYPLTPERATLLLERSFWEALGRADWYDRRDTSLP